MIGDKIHKIRKKKGLTLSELAERANMSKSYLSNIERNLNDNPSIQVVERIAAVLNVDLHTLIEIKHEPSHFLESEWIHFVNELKKLGIRKEQLPEYKAIIEFIKWQNEQNKNVENKR